jgi:TonB family protein
MTMTSRLALIAVVASIATASIARAADEPLADAKALFAAASFDGALAALDRLDAANGTLPEALEYKALCLLALGRSGDALKITEALVTTVPTFAPADADLSPRFVELLTETRRRMVPVIVRRLFAEARDQYRAKNPADARRTFQQVVTLAGDSVWRDTAEADDLRTLASGFLDLLEGAAAPKAAAAEPQPVMPTVVPPPPVAVATAAALAQVQAPVPIRQSMPQWVAPDRVSALRAFHGAIKVRIGADGHVVDVAVATATHPDYDKQLLEAARNWLYKPATRNGEPIEVEKVVDFYLRSK